MCYFTCQPQEGVNGVNRLATKGKKYYRLPTGKLLTDYRDGPALSIFFSERRVYCIFSVCLGSNQRYHVRSLFTSQYHKTRILKRFAERIPKISTTRLALNIICDKCLDKSWKKILSSAMESSTSKPTVRRWAQRQQFPLPKFSCHILKHKV